jgi:Fe-S-cluster containining protein
MSEWNPCLDCGVCCTHFRISFYWGELASAGGWVPDEMTSRFNDRFSVMKNTEQGGKPCIALQGTVGECVSCSIYENRPNPCRDFPAIIDGKINPECNRLRLMKGLAPITEPPKPLLPSSA